MKTRNDNAWYHMSVVIAIPYVFGVVFCSRLSIDIEKNILVILLGYFLSVICTIVYAGINFKRKE